MADSRSCPTTRHHITTVTATVHSSSLHKVTSRCARASSQAHGTSSYFPPPNRRAFDGVFKCLLTRIAHDPHLVPEESQGVNSHINLNVPELRDKNYITPDTPSKLPTLQSIPDIAGHTVFVFHINTFSI